MARPNYPMMGMNMNGIPNMSNLSNHQMNMNMNMMGGQMGYPGMMPMGMGGKKFKLKLGNMLFNPMNQGNPMGSNPLNSTQGLMGLLNRQNLPNSGEYRKVYVGKIPPGLSDAFILKLLEVNIFYPRIIFFYFKILGLWKCSKLETNNRS